MSTNPSSLPDVLARIRKPLEYASRNTSAVKGLDKTIQGLADEGLALEKDWGRKELLRELRIVFLSWESEPESEKKRKVGTALDVLAQLEKLAGVKPPASAPEDASDGVSGLPATLEGEGVLPAVHREDKGAKPASAPLPEWATRADAQSDDDEGDGDDDADDEDDEDDDSEEPIPMPSADPAPGSGAGVLPAVVPSDAERKRRRRRRGGRRRRKNRDGQPGEAGAPGAPDAAAAPQGPRLVHSQPQSKVSGPTPHPEAGPIRILVAEPPIPAILEHDRRPVVRPGDAPLPEVSQPEVSIPEALVTPEEAEAARAAIPPKEKLPPAPPAPRIEDVKAALAKLAAPITEAKGVGPKTAEMFAAMGISTIEDALFDLPRAYQDRSKLTKIARLAPGKVETVMGTVKSHATPRFAGRQGFELIVADDTGEVRAKWFHYFRGMENRYPIGARVIFAGKFEKYKDKLEVTHPEIEVLDEEDSPDTFARVTPVYSLTEGLGQKTRRNIQANLLEFAKDVPPATPFWARQKRGYLAPAEALARVHAPQPGDDAQELAEGRSLWHKSLAYDELFALQAGLALRKRMGSRDRAPALKVLHGLVAKLTAFLPYAVTDAQERVLAEIKRDLMQQRPMHRLMQGDVGSGKTIVALMAALIAIENRTQVAMMAPTEILAEQHFHFVRSTLERVGVRGALLTGGMPKGQRDEILKRISHGEIDIVIGTHALLQEGVQFRNLALVIIDEQHRFGVMQRAALKQKGLSSPGGKSPHVLIMTATPIPRTLALTEFGDLDVSVIDRLPAGRAPIETRVATESERSMVYAQIRSDVSSGRQAYVVFPTVEGTDDAQTIASAIEGQKKLQRDVFPEFRVGLLHGQMSREEKEGTMTRFKNGAIDILATTTVVEVGIDVPNATVMLVEHAERFGLAQLHQLRGRVGRGAAKSRAFFMVAPNAPDDAVERLHVLERTPDGFEVAQVDLALRGPGDITGSRQHGMPPFRMADPVRDVEILVQAREDAFAMIAADTKLREPEHRVVHEVVKHRWRGRLNLSDVG